jgi:type VI secretion system protein ImpK
MKKVTDLTKDCFNAINQLREAQEGVAPAPEILHQRLRGFIDALLERGPREGYQERDVRDMAYALVALADEMALAMSDNVRRYWMANLLQLRYFNENVAGDGFFTHLEGVRRDPRRIEVLEVYYLCLLLGFQGKYAIRGGEIELLNLIDALRGELAQALDIPDELSPSAERPDDFVRKRRGGLPFLWVAIGALALAVGVYAALRVSIGNEGAVARDRLAETGK